MRVYLLQLLCPERHCITALAFEAESDQDVVANRDQAHNVLLGSMEVAGLDPHCGICGSKKLYLEVNKTRFEKLDDAAPELAKTQADNLTTRLALDEAKLTFDSQERQRRN